MVNTTLSQIAKPPSKYIIWGLLFGVFNYVFILSRVITQPIDFDAGSYVWMSRLLFNPDTSFSSSPVTILLLQLRQMGYPVLIAPFTALFGTGALLRVSVSLLHLLIYWLATYSVYRLARQILGQKSADVIVLLLLALPFPYFLIVEVLADSISTSLAMAAIVCGVYSLINLSSLRFYIVSISLSGLLMSIRQDTVYVPMFVGLCGLHFWQNILDSITSRKIVSFFISGLMSVACIVVSVLLFRIPNYIITYRYLGIGSFEPTDYSSIDFIDGGLRTLKYYVGFDLPGNYITTPNPFVSTAQLASISEPLFFYFKYPLDGFLTILTKSFALVDWDAPFVYYDFIPPRANLFLSILNFWVVVNGLIGITLVMLKAKSHESALNTRRVFLYGVISFLPYMGIHTISHVEVRYGLPIIVILTIFLGIWISKATKQLFVYSQIRTFTVFIPLAILFSNSLRDF